MSKPNWREWAHTPDVRLWQACALSLNIDPHSMRATGTGWMAGPGHGPFFDDESFPDDDTKAEFELRLRVLLANLSNREHFSPGLLNFGTPGNHEVRMSEFAAWALSVAKWESLPPELVALVQTSDRKAPASTSQIVGAGDTANKARKPEWTRQARKIGEEWMLAEETRTKKRPTVEQIGRYLEGELSTRGITGPRGKFLDWETIKREALTGITGRAKGDNFRNAKGNPHRK